MKEFLVPINYPCVRGEEQENMYGLKFYELVQVKPLIQVIKRVCKQQVHDGIYCQVLLETAEGEMEDPKGPNKEWSHYEG